MKEIRNVSLFFFVVAILVALLAAPAAATTYYADAEGNVGVVYLYYDETGVSQWGDYAYTDPYGGKYVPSVQWSATSATVLPLGAKTFPGLDENGKAVLDDNDPEILAVLYLRNKAYNEKLAIAQEQYAKTKAAEEQYAKTKAEEEFSWEVPMSERPPGTEDWIWTKTRWAKENWDREKYGIAASSTTSNRSSQNYNRDYSVELFNSLRTPVSGTVQRIGSYDYYNFSNGQSGTGQRIGNYYYYNGW